MKSASSGMILTDALLALSVVLLLLTLVIGHLAASKRGVRLLEERQQNLQEKEQQWWHLNEEACRDRCLIEALIAP